MQWSVLENVIETAGLHRPAYWKAGDPTLSEIGQAPHEAITRGGAMGLEVNGYC
jgi:hypothetical protein